MQTFEEFMNEGRKIDHKDIPTENQGGDCYAVGYQYFMKNYAKNPNLRLCHGLVTSQGAIKGIKYNHCWCEDTKSGNVIDMTMPEFFQNIAIEVYYHIGKVDKDDVFKYDMDQVTAKASEFGTYGPWEDKLLENKY